MSEQTNIRKLVEQELALCAGNHEYAIKKYFMVEHPIQGKISFNLYPFQSKTLQELLRHKYNIILKSRQMGISTLVASHALVNMLFKDNYKVLVIATTQEVAKNLVHKVKVMYSNLPSWLKVPAEDNNKLQLTLRNGSSIKAISSSPTAGRSEALSLLIIDEAAFIDSIDEIWTSAQMTLATGGDAILLSTPNGVDNLFHQLWTDAEMGNSPEGMTAFNPIKLKWDLHPDRDQAWRDQQTHHLGEQKAAQECDCLWGCSMVTVKDTTTGEIFDISLENLYNSSYRLNVKDVKDNYTLKTNSTYEILTPTGFQPFAGIRTLKKNVIYSVTLSNGNKLKCSVNHPFMYGDNIIPANKLKIGTVLSGDSGDVTVTDITISYVETDLYDIVEVNNGNVFNVDGIVSHNCDFLTSGHSVVDGTIIKWYEENMATDPIERRGMDGDYWIWKYPNYTKSYVVSVDVARGDGSDDSCIQVFDVESMEQVAEYIGKVSPRDLGRMAVTISTEYNKALLVIENKNIGYDSVQEAIDIGYQNLFYSYRNDVYVDPAKHISRGYDLKSKKDKVPGFTTNTANRPMIISKIDRYFAEKAVTIYSKRLISQLYVFVWYGGKAQARPGRKDDAVIALGIALFVRDTALKLHTLGIDLTKQALKHMHKRVHKPDMKRLGTEWTQDDGRGNTISTRWLL